MCVGVCSIHDCSLGVQEACAGCDRCTAHIFGTGKVPSRRSFEAGKVEL